MTYECRTQKELDAACKKAKPGDVIACYGGTWDKPLIVRGSSSVTAWNSSSVRAYDSSSVRAYGSSSVTACDSSSVRACDSSSVRAYDSSSVRAYDSSSVWAYDSSLVTAYESSSVRAYDSSSVWAYDSSLVTAYESSLVRACDSSSVRACDSSSVRAGKYVSVHKHRGNPRISGGVLIEVPQEFPIASDWLDFHGLKADKRGTVVLFKAVSDDYGANYNGFKYEPGSKPKAPDWNERPECGGGLHLCATPWQARDPYHPEATRYVGCPVKVDEIVVIDHSKVKVPRIAGKVFECDQDGVKL